jgi:Htaa
VEFADLDLSTATRTIADEVVTITGITATLTEEGAPAFGGFYTAGTALDPINLRLSYAEEDPGPDPDPDPQPPQPKPKPPVVTPPAPDDPGPSVAAARITRTAKSVKVGGRRVALARLACRTGTCTVSTPKRVTVKLGKRKYRLAVLAPKSLAAGTRGTVRVALGKRAFKALAGRKARVTLKVVVSSGEESVTQTVSVTLRRPR